MCLRSPPTLPAEPGFAATIYTCSHQQFLQSAFHHYCSSTLHLAFRKKRKGRKTHQHVPFFSIYRADGAGSPLASQACARCGATLHFCGKFPALFPRLRVQQPTDSLTSTHSTWPARVNFAAHSVRCGLHALQLREPRAYVKSHPAFLRFRQQSSGRPIAAVRRRAK